MEIRYVTLSTERVLRLLAEENRNHQYVTTRCRYHPNFMYKGNTEDGHEAFLEHVAIEHQGQVAEGLTMTPNTHPLNWLFK